MKFAIAALVATAATAVSVSTERDAILAQAQNQVDYRNNPCGNPWYRQDCGNGTDEYYRHVCPEETNERVYLDYETYQHKLVFNKAWLWWFPDCAADGVLTGH